MSQFRGAESSEPPLQSSFKIRLPSTLSPRRNHLLRLEDEDEEYAGLSPELYRMLKCEKCNKFMTGAIHICYSGHNICHECNGKETTSKTNLCPICHSDISPIMRNYEMEKVASKVLAVCPNLNCSLITFRSQMSKHVDLCEMRRFHCPLLKYKYEDEECAWQGTLMDLLLHVEARHPHRMQVSQGKKITLRRFDPSHPLRQIHFFIYDSKFYLYHMRVSVVRSRISWLVQQAGPSHEVEDWSYEVQMFHNFDSDRRVTFSDACIAYNINAEHAIDRGNCASVHLDNLKMFTDEVGTLSFRFILKYKGKSLADDDD